MFKFNIKDQVKVKPYGNVIGGDIILRTLTEDKQRASVSYEVRFPMGIGSGCSTVIVSEKSLFELQLEDYEYD